MRILIPSSTLDVSGKTWHAVLAPPSRMQARGVLK